MPLPINKSQSEISYHNFTLHDNSKIRIRSYKILDIENFMKRVGKREDHRAVQRATFDLLRTCTHPDDVGVLENLDRVNVIYLLVLLRVHSVSDTMPYPHECPNCRTANLEYRIPILKNLKHNYEEIKTLKFTDDFEITFRGIPFSKELELVGIDDEDSRSIYEIYYRIKSIRNGDDVYDVSQFSVDEFRDWLESDPDEFHMTNEQYLEFIGKLDSFDDWIKIETSDTCIACGNPLTMQIDDFSFFITA